MRVVMMEKPDKAKKNLQLLTRQRMVLLVIFVLFLLLCCGKGGKNHENGENTGEELPVETVSGGQQQAGRVREAVLVKGNDWISGIPGFEDNSFSALTGEYRLQPFTEGNERRFSAFLTPEPLYFSGEWQSGSGPGGIRLLQQTTEEGFLAAMVLDDGMGALWTAVFLFPLGLEETELSADAFNQMLRAWSNRFLYFLSLSRSDREMSLPAVVEF